MPKVVHYCIYCNQAWPDHGIVSTWLKVQKHEATCLLNPDRPKPKEERKPVDVEILGNPPRNGIENWD